MSTRICSFAMALLCACGSAPPSSGPATTQPNETPSAPPPEPTEPAEPEQAIAAPGTTRMCDPSAYPTCAAGVTFISVDDAIASAPSGTVVVAGYAVETDEVCTGSMPPSCMSWLSLADSSERPGRTLRLFTPPTAPGFACGGEGDAHCCALDRTSRWAATATIGSDGYHPRLDVQSVCRVP